MAERLIDAEAVEKYPIRRDNYDKENGNIHFINGVESVLEYVNNLPTIEAKPIIYAHWEKDPITGWEYCSHCKEEAPFSKYTDDVYESMFCPACGATMDEFASDNNVGSKGVKIPVISMEDVPKLAKD